MDIIDTTTGVNGFKMKLIHALVESLPEQDDYGFTLVDMVRKKFKMTAQVYGRTDVESMLGFPITDSEWLQVRDTPEWCKLDESTSDYNLAKRAATVVEVF